MAKYQLDARGLLCPMPVIRVQDRVVSLLEGDILEALCSDPGALNDIPAWCRLNGHQILEMHDEGREQRVILQVGPRED